MKEERIVTLSNLKPNKSRKKKFAVYLTDQELQWLKKLTEETKFPSRSSFMAALLNREIEMYKNK